ncbi:hypothetical protein HK096_007101, partial [Nowakowskiella sp. JEL0078]
PILTSCRIVDCYERLNKIDEGAYGIVYRAKDKDTGEIVALKRLKLDWEQAGFPALNLREIHTLLLMKHPNIVGVKEIVVNKSLSSIYIAMEFVEHDLKELLTSLPNPFLQSEIKQLMLQILSAVAAMHGNWIIHRDLKTSNLLMNNRGQIKVADFGLARRFGDPISGALSPLVVTLWYRSPELLLGAKEYSTAVDMWSVGCIFGELVNKEPLFPGRIELDQLKKLLGPPDEIVWPNVFSLPNSKVINFNIASISSLRTRFPYLTENGLDLLSKLLAYDPGQRISAEDALHHPYFTESPLPKDPELMPTFPSKGAGETRNKSNKSPSAPRGGLGTEVGLLDDGFNDEEDELRAAILGNNPAQSFESTRFRLKIK